MSSDVKEAGMQQRLAALEIERDHAAVDRVVEDATPRGCVKLSALLCDMAVGIARPAT